MDCDYRLAGNLGANDITFQKSDHLEAGVSTAHKLGMREGGLCSVFYVKLQKWDNSPIFARFSNSKPLWQRKTATVDTFRRLNCMIFEELLLAI